MSEVKYQFEPSPNPREYQDDEITIIKELIEKILEFWMELWSKMVGHIIMIPFAIFMAYKAKIVPTTFTAP